MACFGRKNDKGTVPGLVGLSWMSGNQRFRKGDKGLRVLNG